MKTLSIRSWDMDREVVAQVNEFIEGICSGDIALAEPSATDLDWTLVSLITAMTECYYVHRQEPSAIIGFACPTCNTVTVSWQDYTLDPEFATASMNEYHEGDSCIAVYLEI